MLYNIPQIISSNRAADTPAEVRGGGDGSENLLNGSEIQPGLRIYSMLHPPPTLSATACHHRQTGFSRNPSKYQILKDSPSCFVKEIAKVENLGILLHPISGHARLQIRWRGGWSREMNQWLWTRQGGRQKMNQCSTPPTISAALLYFLIIMRMTATLRPKRIMYGSGVNGHPVLE